MNIPVINWTFMLVSVRSFLQLTQENSQSVAAELSLQTKYFTAPPADFSKVAKCYSLYHRARAPRDCCFNDGEHVFLHQLEKVFQSIDDGSLYIIVASVVEMWYDVA